MRRRNKMKKQKTKKVEKKEEVFCVNCKHMAKHYYQRPAAWVIYWAMDTIIPFCHHTPIGKNPVSGKTIYPHCFSVNKDCYCPRFEVGNPFRYDMDSEK